MNAKRMSTPSSPPQPPLPLATPAATASSADRKPAAKRQATTTTTTRPKHPRKKIRFVDSHPTVPEAGGGVFALKTSSKSAVFKETDLITTYVGKHVFAEFGDIQWSKKNLADRDNEYVAELCPGTLLVPNKTFRDSIVQSELLLGCFINHSATRPNCRFKHVRQTRTAPPQLLIVATTDIFGGDEILVDYGQEYAKPGFVPL
jgi:SET domain-containing protein